MSQYVTFDLLLKRYRGGEPMRFIPYAGKRFDDDESDLDHLTFHETFDQMQLNTELHNMQLVHRKACESSALHPVLHAIIHGDRTYPAYRNLEPAIGLENEEGVNVLADTATFLRELHANGLYHFDVNLKTIVYHDSSNGERRYTLTEYAKLRTRDTFVTSPLIGSSILAPVQILHEMMSSKREPDNIPFEAFKEKFISFYQRAANMISPLSFDILRTCEEAMTGFVDIILRRLCIIHNEEVIKSTAKLDPAEADRFALAISLWRLFPENDAVEEWAFEVFRNGDAPIPIKKVIKHYPSPVAANITTGMTLASVAVPPAPTPAPVPTPAPAPATKPTSAPSVVSETIMVKPQSHQASTHIPSIFDAIPQPPQTDNTPISSSEKKRTVKYQGQERVVRVDESGQYFILFKGRRIFIEPDDG